MPKHEIHFCPCNNGNGGPVDESGSNQPGSGITPPPMNGEMEMSEKRWTRESGPNKEQMHERKCYGGYQTLANVRSELQRQGLENTEAYAILDREANWAWKEWQEAHSEFMRVLDKKAKRALKEYQSTHAEPVPGPKNSITWLEGLYELQDPREKAGK